MSSIFANLLPAMVEPYFVNIQGFDFCRNDKGDFYIYTPTINGFAHLDPNDSSISEYFVLNFDGTAFFYLDDVNYLILDPTYVPVNPYFFDEIPENFGEVGTTDVLDDQNESLFAEPEEDFDPHVFLQHAFMPLDPSPEIEEQPSRNVDETSTTIEQKSVKLVEINPVEKAQNIIFELIKSKNKDYISKDVVESELAKYILQTALHSVIEKVSMPVAGAQALKNFAKVFDEYKSASASLHTLHITMDAQASATIVPFVASLAKKTFIRELRLTFQEEGSSLFALTLKEIANILAAQTHLERLTIDGPVNNIGLLVLAQAFKDRANITLVINAKLDKHAYFMLVYGEIYSLDTSNGNIELEKGAILPAKHKKRSSGSKSPGSRRRSEVQGSVEQSSKIPASNKSTVPRRLSAKKYLATTLNTPPK